MTSAASKSPNETEEYVRLLLTQKRGYPLWNPRPGEWLPSAYREEGVCIGDVGILTEFGEFDQLFNVCLPANDPENIGRVPEDFKQLEGVDIHSLTWSTEELGPQCIIPSRSSHFERDALEENSELTEVPEDISRGLSLRSSATRGSLLILPEGGKSTDSQQLMKFYQHAADCAQSWYDYVNEHLGRGIHNDALYLITGCDKARSWGVASFTDAPADRVSLSFEPKLTSDGVLDYWFSKCDYAAASGGISHRTNQSGCVFLRGFKIAVRIPRIIPQPDYHVTYISKLSFDKLLPRWQWFFSVGPAALSSVFSGFLGASNNSESDLDAPSLRVYHPSDAINQWILRSCKEVNVAITHDDDWASVIQDDDKEIPRDQDLINRIRRYLRLDKTGQAALAHFDFSVGPSS